VVLYPLKGGVAMGKKEKILSCAEKVSTLLKSPEVQTQLTEAYSKAAKTSDDFREASRVDPESLHKPCSC
jgi:hypothetical protein